MVKCRQQPEFFSGWKMLVVVDLVAYLATIYGKMGGHLQRHGYYDCFSYGLALPAREIVMQ